MPVRGAAAVVQEHVQAQAAAAKVAGGGRLDDGLADQHRQDRGAGSQAQEAHQHRGVRQGGPGAALPQAAQTVRAGDHVAGRLATAGEGGGARVVLQPEAEGKAHDAPEHHGRPAGRRHDGRRPGRRRRRPDGPRGPAPSVPPSGPRDARLADGTALALAQPADALADRQPSVACGSLTFRPVGR